MTNPFPRAGKMVSKRMRCLALISHNNTKPAMQACLLVPIVPTPLPRAARTLYLHFTSLCLHMHISHMHMHISCYMHMCMHMCMHMHMCMFMFTCTCACTCTCTCACFARACACSRPPSASVLHLLPCTHHTRALPPFGPRTPSNSLTYHAHFRNPPRPAFASQDFVKANTNILRRFRLTGTASTMKMLRSVMGEGIEYGPTCASGPLGGDAQVHVGGK